MVTILFRHHPLHPSPSGTLVADDVAVTTLQFRCRPLISVDAAEVEQKQRQQHVSEFCGAHW